MLLDYFFVDRWKVDKVKCAGTKKLDPQFGGGDATQVGDVKKVSQADYSNKTFIDISVGDKHACGRLTTKEVVCFKDKAIQELLDLAFEKLPATVKDYAVATDITYFYDDKGNQFGHRAQQAAGNTTLRDLIGSSSIQEK